MNREIAESVMALMGYKHYLQMEYICYHDVQRDAKTCGHPHKVLVYGDKTFVWACKEHARFFSPDRGHWRIFEYL